MSETLPIGGILKQMSQGLERLSKAPVRYKPNPTCALCNDLHVIIIDAQTAKQCPECTAKAEAKPQAVRRVFKD